MEKWARYKQGQTFPKKSLRFIALTKLVVLAFENLNDNETLMKENIIPPNYGDLMKPTILLEAHLTLSLIHI